MGVCLSTGSSPKPRKNSKNAPRNTHVSKSPPPSHSHPVPEEETVKEVLSETPSGRAKAERQPEGPFIKSAPLLLRDFSRKSANPPKDPRNSVVLKKPSAADDASEDLVSEICSTLGESESVSAAATDDRPRNRSPAKRKTVPFHGETRRDRTVGRSPGRRSRPELSPNHDRPGTGNVRKRDGGEISGRRSRSPATRVDSGNPKPVSGRSASAKRAVKSPGRVGSGLGERTRKVGEERKNGSNNHWPPASDESLENPLASLECFIFL